MKRTAQTLDAQPEPLSTIPEIEAALSQLDAERDATLRALAELPEREREPIAADADDAQLAELEHQHEAIHFRQPKLERAYRSQSDLRLTDRRQSVVGHAPFQSEITPLGPRKLQ